jgi:alpha-N-arabinofuranosidase
MAEVFHNPILSGFHPDPSLCRVEDDYYLVNSSFEYFPGVPVFHSKDLVHWEQIGHCLTREKQLNLRKAASSAGIYAPVLRFHGGVFYMITTLMPSGGSFIVMASDPAGPWSDPIRVLENTWGMDPSLLFDDDGKVYYTRHGEAEHGGEFQAEIDPQSGRLLGEARKIWAGTGGVWPEGPHLYKIGGFYYLMIAEGGTGYGHSVTLARSPSPWGPFEPCPRNPILTHRDRPEHPIQATGHADLVQAADGSWWAVLLGIRPQGGKFHHLGRETFLAPVSWDKDGWPEIGKDGAVELTMEAPRLRAHSFAPGKPRDEFDGNGFALCWNFLRNPYTGNYSLTDRPGWLRLKGTSVTLDEEDSTTFLGRRQEHFKCRASTLLDFTPKAEGQEAGLALRADEKFHYDLGVTRSGGGRKVFLRLRTQGVSRIAAEKDLLPGHVTLCVQAQAEGYEFLYAMDDGKFLTLGKAPARDLSTEVAGGFTGVYFGLYAFHDGKGTMPPADFDWFEYLPGEQE